MRCIGIYSCKQTGKSLISIEKRHSINWHIAYHFGKIFRDFQCNIQRQGNRWYEDGTFFKIHLHTNNTLALKGYTKVKYEKMVSRYERITLLVLLNGSVIARLEPCFVIIKRTSQSYSIWNFLKGVPVVSYRSSAKSWMEKRLFPKWLRENCLLRPGQLNWHVYHSKTIFERKLMKEMPV